MKVLLLSAMVLLCGLAGASVVSVGPQNCLSGVDVVDRQFQITDEMMKTPAMQYAMDTAINRAIFYSLMYRWSAYELTWGRPTPPQALAEYSRQPGLNYIYMSTSASVHAAPAGVETAGLFFDADSSYPNWLRDVAFNGTVPLFGVRADASTVKDLGSTPETNYTDATVYPQNEFYKELRRSNTGTAEPFLMNYYDPTDSQAIYGFQNKINGEAVHFTKPIFDCGQTNTWMVNSVSMATEILARMSLWQSLRHNRSVAASTVGVRVEAVDPDYRDWRAHTTLPASRLQAGQAELDQQDSNRCRNLVSPDPPIPLAGNYWTTDHLALTLEAPGRAGLRLAHFLSNFLQNNDYADNARHIQIMNEAYARMAPGDFTLPVFDDPMVEVIVDQGLTRRQLVSEAYATAMSTTGLSGVGIFLDTGVFPNSSSPVSAFAWRNDNPWSTVDLEGTVTDVYAEGFDFTREAWFLQAKQTFAHLSDANTHHFSNGRTVRTSKSGAPRPTPQPVTYIATSYEQGTWLPPHFLCGPRQSDWAASYVAPILVKGDGQAPRFGGVVKIDAIFTAKDVSP